MKRFLLFWSAAAMLLGSSCSETGFDEPDKKPDTDLVRMYVSDETTESEAANAKSSRAHFADGYKIAWDQGDEVAIVKGTPYALQQDATGRWYVELPSAESYTVYYPAALCGFDDKGLFGSRIPTPQTYRSGSFDPTTFCSRAVANRGEKLTFKYLCSVVKITLRGTAADQVRKISIATADLGDELICGAGLILTEADGTAYLSPMTGDKAEYSRRYVDLDVNDVALNSEGVDFYLTIFPTTFSRGFTLNVTLADGRMMAKTGAVGQRAARGRILAMPAIRFEASGAPVFYSTDNISWKPWEYAADGTTPATLPYPQNTNNRLYFKDNVAASGTKGLTLAHFQSLHDTFMTDGMVNGNLYASVVAVNPIGFDFSQATYESDVLPNNIFTRNGEATNPYNINMRYISLPKNIREIANNALRYNLVMHTVILPQSVEKIGALAFEVSRGLHSDGDSPDPEKQGVFCYATTPPSFGVTAFDWNNGKFHVPAASLSAYEAVWASDPLGAKLSRMTLVGDL